MPKKKPAAPVRSTAGTESDDRELGAGRVAFVTHQPAIEVAIVAGKSLRMIYAEYQDRLGISYSNFSRYVRKYIRSAASVRQPPKPPIDRSAAAGKPAAIPPKQSAGGQPKFQYDPLKGDEEELI